MAKKTYTQTFTDRKKKASRLERLIPFVFWGFIIVAILCFIFAIITSVGNLNEIIQKLNSKKYTGEELQANYNALIEKYGEWTIGNGGAGFQIRFVNIARAFFSGLMIANFTLCGISLLLAFLLGKWILPKTAKMLREENSDLVSLAVLEEKDKREQGE